MQLPIARHREAIVTSVRLNQVTIIVGETGSGKTTAVPQFLYEAGFGRNGIIGITEPRRIAATSVARFVAGKLGTSLGKTVAHKIRFQDETNKNTVLKFMTDGILLREMHDDPLLSKYSVIMIDEAHERSANIDFLLGLLKGLLIKRPELRLVVASATIDADKFSRYLGGAPIIKVDGRLHPVEIIWANESAQSHDRLQKIVGTIDTCLNRRATGDILVFLTGIDEIDAVSEALDIRGFHNLEVLPAHGSLSPEDQGKVFHTYPGKRKVVLATNIAETSITIDGVVFVVDGGLIKQTNFHPKAGLQSLDVVEHSKAGCDQRAGRAGRTEPGVCYRLYTEHDYNLRPAFTEPEIKRMSLAGVVLAMEALEIPNIRGFDFIDPPDSEVFQEAYKTLEVLGAIEIKKPGLTAIGKEMAALPLEPRVSRMIVEAKKYGCVDDVLTVAAFMSVGRSVFVRPKDKEWEADRAHARFKNPKSDMLTFVKVWAEYVAGDFDRDWCFTNFLAAKTLQEVRNIRSQLLQQLSRSEISIDHSDDENALLRCVASGLAYNLLRCTFRHEYEGVERPLYGVFVHPGSSVFGYTNPQWLVSAEIVETKRRFARMCSAVDPSWLADIAPTRFSLGDPILHRYTSGDKSAVVRRSVFYLDQFGNQTQVGSQNAYVSLAEARDIQRRNMNKAEASGWIRLTFEQNFRSGYGMIARGHDGQEYRLSYNTTMMPEDKLEYYCKIETAGLFASSTSVSPQFPVLNLPQEEEPSTSSRSKGDLLSKIETRPNDGSLGAILAEAARKRASA